MKILVRIPFLGLILDTKFRKRTLAAIFQLGRKCLSPRADITAAQAATERGLRKNDDYSPPAPVQSANGVPLEIAREMKKFCTVKFFMIRNFLFSLSTWRRASPVLVAVRHLPTVLTTYIGKRHVVALYVCRTRHQRFLPPRTGT
jgi:hypothetical protein